MANYLDHLALPVIPPLEGDQYANLIEELALWVGYKSVPK